MIRRRMVVDEPRYNTSVTESAQSAHKAHDPTALQIYVPKYKHILWGTERSGVSITSLRALV